MAKIEGQRRIWECAQCGGMHGHPLHKLEWLNLADRIPKPFCQSAVKHVWLCSSCWNVVLRTCNGLVEFAPYKLRSPHRQEDLRQGMTVVTEADEAYNCQCSKETPRE